MVTINTLEIDNLATLISVDISTEVGNIFTNVNFWTTDTFKKDSLKVDLSSKLVGASNNETFTVSPTDVGLTEFCGVFFLEFISDETIDPDDCDSPTNAALGTVGFLIKYQECMMNLALSIDLTNCTGVQSFTDCDDCTKDLLFISSLFTVLQEAIIFGYNEEAIRIIESLDVICDNCSSCPELGDIIIVESIKTIDNQIVIQ